MASQVLGVGTSSRQGAKPPRIELKLEHWMGLEINGDKTRVIDLRQREDKLDFLGYTFRYDRDLKGRRQSYLNVTLSKKPLKRERQKRRGMISKQRYFVPLPQMIEDLNGHLTGIRVKDFGRSTPTYASALRDT
jgi:hypothetical protein